MSVETWEPTHKGDNRCRELADRHYSRQRPGHPMWTRPGYNYVLYLRDERGAAVFCWWRPKWEAGQERRDGLRAVECTIFRNESAHRSSDLVRHAVDALSWPEARRALSLEHPAAHLLITSVNSAATAGRRSRRALPGKCFREAGWVDLPHAKGRADVWLQYRTAG